MVRLGLQHAFEQHSDPIPTEEYRWVDGKTKSATSLIQNHQHLHRRSGPPDILLASHEQGWAAVPETALTPILLPQATLATQAGSISCNASWKHLLQHKLGVYTLSKGLPPLSSSARDTADLQAALQDENVDLQDRQTEDFYCHPTVLFIVILTSATWPSCPAPTSQLCPSMPLASATLCAIGQDSVQCIAMNQQVASKTLSSSVKSPAAHRSV